jgi:cyclic pyranopterin phosphate synthase
MSQLTHLDDRGAARMVDVGHKAVTERIAVAAASVSMQSQTMALLEQGAHKKGDVLAVARIAGIQAAKKCADLIPLCHPLMLTSVEVSFDLEPSHNRVNIEARCKVSGKTGVEMEALTAVSVAALTIYDMCKAVDRGIEIGGITLLRKEGGKSGVWRREDEGATQC